MARILNLTQHKATQDQMDQGVLDLLDFDHMRVKKLLTFEKIPNYEELRTRARKVREIASRYPFDFVMLGGAPWFMSFLEEEFTKYGKSYVYAFSARETVERTLEDGSIKKVSTFVHKGFVESGPVWSPAKIRITEFSRS